MIYLILTKKGFEELAGELGRTSSPAWINRGVMNADEAAKFREEGAEITLFTYELPRGDIAALEDELAIMRKKASNMFRSSCGRYPSSRRLAKLRQ